MSTQERKIQERENRRQEILKAAEGIMLKKGIHGLNVDLIAAETQLAKGTIYLYFKSKEEIIGVLSTKARTLVLHEFEKMIKKEPDPVEQLKGIFMVNYQFFKKHPLHYALISMYEANEQLIETDEMYKPSAAIIGLVVDIVERGQKNGSINKGINPGQFTMCYYGMIVGFLQLVKVRGGIVKERMKISEKELTDQFLFFLAQGLK